MAGDTPTLNIPKDLIEPIIQAHIAAAVTTALGGREKVVSDAIYAALNMKVDDRGAPSTYSSGITFVQWLMKDAIRKAAIEAMQIALEGQKEEMKKAIADELRKSRSVVAKTLIEALANQVTNGGLRYNLAINIAERT